MPRLLLIADGFASGRANQIAEEVQDRAYLLVYAGLSFVQVRDHEAGGDRFAEATRDLVHRLRAIHSNILLVVNSKAELAHELGCGVHVGRGAATSFPFSRRERGGVTGEPTGYSAHSLEDLQRASDAGFDYATLSPIFQTHTHLNAQPLGLEALHKACSAVPEVPVFALGGITSERTRACLDAGAHGVAVLSDLLDAADPVERLDEYRNAGVL